MLYFDTSFVVPLILQETASTMVEGVFARLEGGRLVISQWTRVEFASMLAREVRMGRLSATAAAEADDVFDSVANESFLILLPTAADYETAREFLRRPGTGLRGGDALHLAIAKNHGATAVYSLDRTMLLAGRQLGLTMIDD